MEVIAEKPTLATGWWDVTTGERNDRLDVLNIFVSTFYLAPDRYCRAPSKASSPIRSLKSIYLSFLDPVEKKEENESIKAFSSWQFFLIRVSRHPSRRYLGPRHLTKRFTP